MQIKPGDAERFLTRPSGETRIVLLYGPDAGLVSERAERFVAAIVGDSTDPFARLRLDSDDLGGEPGRLASEAYAISLFGGRRAIRLRASGARSIVPALEPLLERPPTDAWVVIEAGDLRKTAPLRRLIESAKKAAAIACYSDNGRGLDGLIAEELGSAGLSLDPAAARMLRQLLGEDRLSARSELRKLACYAAGEPVVTAEMVRATIGDAADLDVDDLVDHVAGGEVANADRAYRRLRATGTDPTMIAGAVQRHLQQIHRWRSEVDTGSNADSIIDAASPPIFFKRRDAVRAQVQAWRLPALENALQGLAGALVASRLAPTLAEATIWRALVSIARWREGDRAAAGTA